MTSIRDYSTTAGSNTAVGGVSIAEGMVAAGLNNAIRAAMADLASYRAFLEGAKITAGTANAQTLTTGLSIAAYAAPLLFFAKIGTGLSNTGAMTLALDGLSAKSVKKTNGTDPLANEVKALSVHGFAYQAADDIIFLLNPAPLATSYQPLDATLTALAAYNTNGIIAQTAADTFAGRTITGTSNEVSVANGDGVSGAPTLSLPSTLALRGKAVQVQDSNFTVADDGDATKLIAFQASGITTGTTRTLTIQDASGIIGYLDVAGQAVTGGGIVTSKSLGTVSSGTLTLSMGDRPLQHYTNNGAHTLAPGTNNGACVVDVTNGASAGAVTTSGWTKVSGSFDTTNAHKFRCHASVGNTGSLLVIMAMQ